MTCSIEGCNRPAKARGWCNTHYERWRQHGDPNRELTPAMRFWRKVKKTTKCWLWTGAITSSGYGHLWHDSRFQQAHRVSYQLEVGPIADGKQIDHLCMTKLCVRPDHLEQVTAAENNARSNSLSAIRARMETCSEGHEFTTGSNGRRYCPTCRAAKDRARRVEVSR